MSTTESYEVMYVMRPGQIKHFGKRIALKVGLYRPARYFSDLLTNRVSRQRLSNDIQLYRTLLEPGTLCFDVGANIGMKSFAMLAVGANVVAFEPQPECLDEITARCSKFKARLRTSPKALGSAAGQLELHTDSLKSNYASFRREWDVPLPESLVVQVTTLDDAIAEFGSPSYLKIDVEGWELEVLKGLSSPIDLISFEYHLNESQLSAAHDCASHLKTLSTRSMELNIVGAEASRFEFDTWISEEEFFKIFPSNFMGRPGFAYGDIWVRLV